MLNLEEIKKLSMRLILKIYISFRHSENTSDIQNMKILSLTIFRTVSFQLPYQISRSKILKCYTFRKVSSNALQFQRPILCLAISFKLYFFQERDKFKYSLGQVKTTQWLIFIISRLYQVLIQFLSLFLQHPDVKQFRCISERHTMKRGHRVTLNSYNICSESH